MTFDDDFAEVPFLTGVRRVTLRSLGIEWPPPERLEIMGFGFQRVSMSEISDEARASMSHVARGAAYESETHPPADSIFRNADSITASQEKSHGT